jgi:GT2 family glycosyltransferase
MVSHPTRQPPRQQGLPAYDPALLREHVLTVLPDPVDPPLLLTAADARLQPGLTVAICTYKRPASLRGFLDSLAQQEQKPEQLIVVDASPDEQTAAMVRSYAGFASLAHQARYLRVDGPLRGLTRQRNLALACVCTDMVAFFDDDIVLLAGCLVAMQAAYRAQQRQVATAGIGAYIRNEAIMRPELRLLWQFRLLLGLVSSLEPGRYSRSGMQIPWSLLAPTRELVEGDWLPGCAMLWNAEAARAIGFHHHFSGYSNGEDLEFSLNMRAHGRIFVAGRAHLLHLHDEGGRPDNYQMGYQTLYNTYCIHCTLLPNRTWRDAAWFLYAYAVDTLLRFAAGVARARRDPDFWQFFRGRAAFLAHALTGRL